MLLRRRERPKQNFRRLCLPAPIRVIYENGNGREVFFGYAHNISSGGMFINTANPKELESTHRIKFSLPAKSKHKTISVTASVIWRREFSPRDDQPPGMGISFLDLAAEDAECIEDFVTLARLRDPN